MECMPEAVGARSDALPVPIYIADGMPAVKSMADGVHYDSKSAIRASYRNGPIRYEEVGNDTAHLRHRAPSRPDPAAINDSVEKAVARFERGERVAIKG